MMLRPVAEASSQPLTLPQQPTNAQPWAVVCGDIHLRPQQRDAFYGFLQSLRHQPPRHLIILGDLFDYWLDSPHFVRTYEELFRRLRDLRAAGCSCHLVLGNRELVAGCYLQSAFPGPTHRRQLDVLTDNGRLRVVHGDRLVRDPGYRFMAAILQSWWFRSWQACAPLIMHRWCARLLRANSQRRGRKVAELGPPLRILDPRRVAAAGRGCHTLLAGHIHQQWQHRLRGIDFYLCGHWDEGYGRWLALSAGGQVVATGGAFTAP